MIVNFHKRIKLNRNIQNLMNENYKESLKKQDLLKIAAGALDEVAKIANLEYELIR